MLEKYDFVSPIHMLFSYKNKSAKTVEVIESSATGRCHKNTHAIEQKNQTL
jgi:hypothetical protein